MIYLVIALIVSFYFSLNLYIKQLKYLKSIMKIYLKFFYVQKLVLLLKKDYQFYNDDTIDKLFNQLILIIDLIKLFLES